jgi:hypothetical protein
MVRSRISPPSFSALGLSARRSTSEGAAYELLLPVGEQQEQRHGNEEHHGDDGCGKNRIDQQALHRERVPGQPGGGCEQKAGCRGRWNCTGARGDENEKQAEQDPCCRLRPFRPIGAREEHLSDDLVDYFGMDEHTRQAGRDRGRHEIAQADRACADKHNAPFEIGCGRCELRGIAAQYGARRDDRHCRQAGEIDPELAVRTGRHIDRTGAQRRHRGDAGVDLAAGAGRADHE